MKKIYLSVYLIGLLFSTSIQAQEYFKDDANKLVQGAEHIRFTNFSDLPDYVKFSPGKEVNEKEFFMWLNQNIFEKESSVKFNFTQTNSDEVGLTHQRFQQLYQGVPVDGAILNTHSKNGKIISFNGRLAGFNTPDYAPSFSEQQALNAALKHIGAKKYKWELPEEEKFMQKVKGTSYFPVGKLVWYAPDGDFKNKPLRKAWKFSIYAHDPMSFNDVLVDAQNGQILNMHDRIHHANTNGTAVTGYNGTQTITTDSYNGSYRLRETVRGNGINTFNMNRGTSYGNAVDFTDADNYWNNVNTNLDQYATDAHWGLEKTYDYFFNVHNRNSLDNNGIQLLAYVHYDENYYNAFWDGTAMSFGDGDNNNPLVALDICGHELSHGITEYTAGLVYQNESGALNESFSDIFGAAIEFYTTPAQADWLMGEDIGVSFRSMSNPNAYGDPDTYLGTNWYTGTGDNGGVHYNSGVQNYWFYLLSEGGSGTNDIGNAFNVTGIGISDAAKIAYRNLTVYLGQNSGYADARFYAIQSAIDLFGACTSQVIATTNAWYAVGVGTVFNNVVTANFTADATVGCSVPFTVSFTNQSANAGTFLWNFGDGATSTQVNPVHTYTNYGNYTVTLHADGNTCGTDDKIQNNYINIDANNPCIAILPTSGVGPIQSSCTGTMFDNGGSTGNYIDNTDVSMTISPPGASAVSVDFTAFNLEDGWDYLYIYDGPSTASPLIGQYTGTNLPNNGNPIFSTSGSITIRQTADQIINKSGFALSWSCVLLNSPPIVSFMASPVTSCSGEVSFSDNSTPVPTSWLWDFGDGNTSTDQNPIHTYVQNGTYTVSLTATNQYGSNTHTITSYITINKPLAPTVHSGFRCDPGTVNLSADALSGGTLSWYDQPTGGTALSNGPLFTTPALSTTTNYYVEESVPPVSQYVGPANNTIGTGAYFNGTQSLLFTSTTPFTLVSVQVYANTAGNRTIELKNSSGTVLQSITTNIPNGSSRVTLNFNVPVGVDLLLGATANANLYRNNAGVVYPYTIPGVVSITNSTAGGTYYYSFYDWEIKTAPCVSPRSLVTATILAPPIGTGASRCGTGTVTLNANGNNNLNWYDASSGGNLLGTGSSFTTPVITATTTYYVETNAVNPTQYVGPATNSFGNGANYTGNQYLIFDCLSPFNLLSVKVYATGSGNRTIQLRNSSGTVLQSITANVPDGESRVTLNFPVTSGTQYQLGITGTPNLFRNSDNTSYPYTIPGLVSITGSSASQSGYYYFFYDWEILQPGCSTSRTPVIATVNPQPSVTAPNNQSICAGNQVTLTATGVSGSILWTPGGATTPSITVSPNSTTTYTVAASNSCGSTSAQVTVTVSPQPTVSAPANQSICSGNQVTLTATGISGNIVWTPGGATTPSITVSPNSTTTYTVAATNSCGSTSAQVTVTVDPQPSVTAPNNQSICAGNQVTLTATGVSGNILWTPGGATTPSITVSPNSTTTYTVAASNSCGTESSMVTITVQTPVTPIINFSNDTLFSSPASSYQWYLNGVAINGADDSLYIPLIDGNYSVETTDSNGCTVVSSEYQYFHTALKEHGIIRTHVYPNPNVGNFYIESNEAVKEIAIYNTLGQVINHNTKEYSGNKYSIDLKDKANGLYFLKLYIGNQILTEKITINQ